MQTHPSDDESLVNRYAGCDSSRLLIQNQDWARSMLEADKNYFRRHKLEQKPRYFWIGCSDSRVSAAQTLALAPGEVFVHRNVANLAQTHDPNFAASLHYAVETLAVRHILIVGHYGCGGIQAAMEPLPDDSTGRWLYPVHDLHCSRPGLDTNRLAEQNVSVQVDILARNPIILAAWERGQKLTLHGWIYDISDGLLRPVCNPVSSPEP